MFSIQEVDSNWTSQVQSLCYVVSAWDRDVWQAYLQEFPHVQKSVNQGMNIIPGWELFCEEVFHRLFTVPQPIPYDQLRPEVLWAHQLHQTLNGSVDFGEMALSCRNNKLAAGVGTYRLIELAKDLMPSPPKGFHPPSTLQEWEAEYIKTQAGVVALEQAQTTLQAKLQAEADPAQCQSIQQQLEQVGFDLKQLQTRLKKIGRQMGRANQAAQDYANQLGLAIADSLTLAIQEAMEAVKCFTCSMNAFGWGEGMGMLNIPGNAQEKQKIAQRLTKDARFRKIAEAAGRFQAIAALRQGAKKSRQIPDEVADTSLGNNLSRLVPSEWVRIAMDGLKALFLKDYADESLTQVEFDGAVDEGQGAIVVCLDKSDSMNWNGGEKEIASTGLMLALIAIAQQQQRNARVILFDDPERYVKDLNPLTATPQDRIDLADRRYSGGTNFMAPLNLALQAVEYTPELQDADIILITDGEADVTDQFSQEWRAAQKRLKFKVYTLLIGEYVNPQVLDKFSDRTIHVADLDDPQVHQLFDI